MMTLSKPFPHSVLLDAKARLLRLHYESNAGHIGGNLSCLEAMLTLHLCVLSKGDQFVLSKGHSAGALYVALWAKGLLPDEILSTFCADNSVLPAHPSGSGIPGLLFPTGSLGHGPSLAAGLALALKHRKKEGHIYCLCSDGEWQEGSCWEALIFAVAKKLDNLVVLVDQNGWQGFGSTEEIAAVHDLSPRFKAFGAQVAVIDGHDPEAVLNALSFPDVSHVAVPKVVVLNTRKGRGLDFEDRLESHYLPLTQEHFEKAVREIQKEYR